MSSASKAAKPDKFAEVDKQDYLQWLSGTKGVHADLQRFWLSACQMRAACASVDEMFKESFGSTRIPHKKSSKLRSDGTQFEFGRGEKVTRAYELAKLYWELHGQKLWSAQQEEHQKKGAVIGVAPAHLEEKKSADLAEDQAAPAAGVLETEMKSGEEKRQHVRGSKRKHNDAQSVLSSESDDNDEPVAKKFKLESGEAPAPAPDPIADNKHKQMEIEEPQMPVDDNLDHEVLVQLAPMVPQIPQEENLQVIESQREPQAVEPAVEPAVLQGAEPELQQAAAEVKEEDSDGNISEDDAVLMHSDGDPAGDGEANPDPMSVVLSVESAALQPLLDRLLEYLEESRKKAAQQIVKKARDELLTVYSPSKLNDHKTMWPLVKDHSWIRYAYSSLLKAGVLPLDAASLE